MKPVDLHTRIWLFALWLAVLGAGSAWAQVFPGRIVGTVTDSQGAVVPSADIKLSAPAIGLERKAMSDSNGNFRFVELPLAAFDLTISKTGFKTWVQKGITTSVGQVNEVNATLQVGDVNSTVEVTAAPPLLQIETNALGGVLSERQVSQLPIGNNDFVRLALVLPGATNNNAFATATYTINGSRSASQAYMIDGASNTDPDNRLNSVNQGGNSATAATRLPPDAIEEVRVVAAGPADLMETTGGVMDVVLKSGTNSFHGSAYESHRDAALDAHNFFENLGGIKKAPFIWNEFGVTAGGPLFIPGVYDGRNRTFIFGAYDGSRSKLGTTLSSRAPTDAQTQQATALLATRGISPNPEGLAILNLYKPLSGNFVVNNRGSQRPNDYVLKVDHRISDKDSLSARYLLGSGTDQFPEGNPGAGGGSQLEKYFGVTPARAHNFAISDAHIISPTVVNTVRLGYNRTIQFGNSRDKDFDPSSIGLNTGVGPADFGLPEIDVGVGPGKFVNLGSGRSPRGRTGITFQVTDDLSLTRGLHSLKFGATWFRNVVYGFNDNRFRGILVFNGTQLGSSLTTDGGLAGLIDLLAGLPAPGNTFINRGSTRWDITQNIISLYGMDTIKLTPRFTLIPGLRWVFQGVPNETRSRFADFLPNLGLVTTSQLPDGQIYKNVWTNFEPRLGMSYLLWSRPGHQTVIRTGYGIYHDTAGIRPLEALTQNPVGATGVFSSTPAAPIPFGPGVPIFGVGTPKPPFNVNAIQQDLKPQNAQEWNLNIEQELSPRLVLQVGYVGTKGTHMWQALDVNQPTPGPAAGNQSRRPFNTLFPNLRQILTISSVGSSSYNAFQAALRSRAFHGLTSQVSYTWSHSINTGDATSDLGGTTGFQPPDSTNLARSRGNSMFDQRQALLFSYVYDLPIAKLARRWGIITEGWQLSGSTTFRDGLATPVFDTTNPSGTSENRDRPDCVGPIVYQLSDLTKPYVVSGLAPAQRGTFGNCPRNPITAPGLNDWDIGLTKNTRLREGMTLQFRVDFFNAFNRPNFSQPSPDLSTRITSTVDDGAFDSHFGVGGPRNIQLNLKVIW
jgi:Carboxypeptidase regulatory-like domain